MKAHTKALIDRLKWLRAHRYRILVVCSRFASDKASLMTEVCSSVGGKYIDVGSQLLPLIDRPVLGAYDASDLVRWMEGELRQSDQMVWFDEIEGLLATFGRAGATRFFEVLGDVETSQPGIVATYLENELTRANFPKERIYHLIG
ncbi:hypothetical protein M1N21_00030 [Dehalococcoidia bacterium]|nr:hypothetical protein [Dehalococcoidia bacterium]